MDSLSIFSSEEFGQVRAVLYNDEPWFVARDVCAALALDVDSGARGLDDDEKGLHIVQTPGGAQKMSVVSESGLYALVFKSRKENAKRFRKWITAEVIPQIRKTGSYSVSPALPDFSNPAAAARAWADEYEAKMAALDAVTQLTAQNNELRVTLGCAVEWKQVIAIEFLYEYFDMKDKVTLQQIGRQLSALSRALGKEIKRAEHSAYPNGVGVYHISVIEAFKTRLMTDPTFLGKYRVRRSIEE